MMQTSWPYMHNVHISHIFIKMHQEVVQKHVTYKQISTIASTSVTRKTEISDLHAVAYSEGRSLSLGLVSKHGGKCWQFPGHSSHSHFSHYTDWTNIVLQTELNHSNMNLLCTIKISNTGNNRNYHQNHKEYLKPWNSVPLPPLKAKLTPWL